MAAILDFGLRHVRPDVCEEYSNYFLLMLLQEVKSIVKPCLVKAVTDTQWSDSTSNYFLQKCIFLAFFAHLLCWGRGRSFHQYLKLYESHILQNSVKWKLRCCQCPTYRSILDITSKCLTKFIFLELLKIFSTQKCPFQPLKFTLCMLNSV